MVELSIRLLKTMPEMDRAVELQKIYWGESADALVPAHMLYSIANYGGHVIGAWDGGRLVGVSMGFIGTDIYEDTSQPAAANLLIMSKRLIVLPDYRGSGVGYKLKLAQRDIAIKQGIRLVTWTYDPMLATNAYLNIHKLGAVCKRYRTDYFDADSRNSKLSGDRLVVDWWVTHPHVEERISDKRNHMTLKNYLDEGASILNSSALNNSGWRVPGKIKSSSQGTISLVEIPPQFSQVEAQDGSLANEWRLHIRQVLTSLLMKDFIVTDFIRESNQNSERTFYVLRYNADFDFQIN